MKALITGGAGFIGSHTADLLLENNYEVRIFDNLEPPVHPKRKKPDYITHDMEFVQGDVRNRNQLEIALEDIDYVFHFAANQGYLPEFSKFAEINDFGTALLYEIIINKQLPIKKVIVASSQAVYGEGKYLCSEHGVQYPELRKKNQLEKKDWDVRCPICFEKMENLSTEEFMVNPHNQYSISKYSQELYSLILGKRWEIPTVALRYSITQGARQSFYNAYSGILRIFSSRMINEQPVPVYEDGTQLRDYVSVKDVALANLLVMESNTANYDVFNVGGNEVKTVLEYVDILKAVYGREVRVQQKNEYRFGDVRHIVSDITKIKMLGWCPTVSIKQIVTEYLEWLEKQPEVDDYYEQAEQKMKQFGVIR